MNTASLNRRLDRVERTLAQQVRRYPLPDFAAEFSSVERTAELLLTAWRVAQLNAIDPEELGYPSPEALCLSGAPTTAVVSEWFAYRGLVWDDLVALLSPDSALVPDRSGA